jgi:O-antigen/teichoic acid export membrane protein
MASSVKYQGWIASGIYNGLQKLSMPIFGVLSTMLLAKSALQVEEMGVWSLFLTITSFVELFRQALVKTSLIKFINHSTAEEQKYVLTAALFLNAVITLILCMVLLVCSGWIAGLLKAPSLAPMMQIFVAGMLLLIPFSHFEWIMYGKVQFKGLFWTYFIRQGLSLLLIAVIFFSTGKMTLNLLVIIYATGILAGTAVAYKYVKPFLTGSFSLSKEWIKRLWHFGKYVFGSGVSTLVFRNADQMLLSSIMGGTYFTALQSISSRVINLADIPSQVLADILFPKSASREHSSNPQMIKYFYEKTVGATLCFVLPVVLFILIFPKFIIFILAGSKYYGAIPYLQLISFSGIFLAFLKQYGVIIDSTGKPQVNFLTITIIALLQILFCYFFIKNFGLMGAGYALLCTHFIGFLITQRILRAYFNVNFLNCFKYAFQFYPELTKIFLDKLKLKMKAL